MVTFIVRQRLESVCKACAYNFIMICVVLLLTLGALAAAQMVSDTNAYVTTLHSPDTTNLLSIEYRFSLMPIPNDFAGVRIPISCGSVDSSRFNTMTWAAQMEYYNSSTGPISALSISTGPLGAPDKDIVFFTSKGTRPAGAYFRVVASIIGTPVVAPFRTWEPYSQGSATSYLSNNSPIDDYCTWVGMLTIGEFSYASFYHDHIFTPVVVRALWVTFPVGATAAQIRVTALPTTLSSPLLHPTTLQLTFPSAVADVLRAHGSTFAIASETQAFTSTSYSISATGYVVMVLSPTATAAPAKHTPTFDGLLIVSWLFTGKAYEEMLHVQPVLRGGDITATIFYTDGTTSAAPSEKLVLQNPVALNPHWLALPLLTGGDRKARDDLEVHGYTTQLTVDPQRTPSLGTAFCGAAFISSIDPEGPSHVRFRVVGFPALLRIGLVATDAVALRVCERAAPTESDPTFDTTTSFMELFPAHNSAESAYCSFPKDSPFMVGSSQRVAASAARLAPGAAPAGQQCVAISLPRPWLATVLASLVSRGSEYQAGLTITCQLLAGKTPAARAIVHAGGAFSLALVQGATAADAAGPAARVVAQQSSCGLEAIAPPQFPGSRAQVMVTLPVATSFEFGSPQNQTPLTIVVTGSTTGIRTGPRRRIGIKLELADPAANDINPDDNGLKLLLEQLPSGTCHFTQVRHIL